MNISITVPDAVADRVLAAFTTVFQYDVASGLTEPQFVRKKLQDFLREVVESYEATAAAETARQAAVAKANADIAWAP